MLYIWQLEGYTIKLGGLDFVSCDLHIQNIKNARCKIQRETIMKTGKLKLRWKMETHTIGQNEEIITTIYKDM